MNELVPPAIGRVVFSWRKAAWLYAMLMPALVWGRRSVTTGSFIVSALLTFITVCIGHSVGLHRGVIHRTYRCSRRLRAVLLFRGDGRGLVRDRFGIFGGATL